MPQALPPLTPPIIDCFFRKSQSKTRVTLCEDPSFATYFAFFDCAGQDVLFNSQDSARAALFRRGGLDCLVLHHLEAQRKKTKLPSVPEEVAGEALKRILKEEEMSKIITTHRATDFYLKKVAHTVYSRFRIKIDDAQKATQIRETIQKAYEPGLYLGRWLLAETYAQLPNLAHA